MKFHSSALFFLIFISCNSNQKPKISLDKSSCTINLETSLNKLFNTTKVANHFKSRYSVHLEIPYMSDGLTFKNFNGTVISLNNKATKENIFKSVYYTESNDYSILVFKNEMENSELNAVIKCNKDSIFVDKWNIREF